MAVYNRFIKNETILVRLITNADIGFWQYQFLGILSLFIEKRRNYLIITNKRILICVKDKVITNALYNGFNAITVNTKSDVLQFKTKENTLQKVSLSVLGLDYEDYQYLKQRLAVAD